MDHSEEELWRFPAEGLISHRCPGGTGQECSQECRSSGPLHRTFELGVYRYRYRYRCVGVKLHAIFCRNCNRLLLVVVGCVVPPPSSNQAFRRTRAHAFFAPDKLVETTVGCARSALCFSNQATTTRMALSFFRVCSLPSLPVMTIGLRFVLWRLHSEDEAPFSFASDEVSMSNANRMCWFVWQSQAVASGADSALPSDKGEEVGNPTRSRETKHIVPRAIARSTASPRSGQTVSDARP